MSTVEKMIKIHEELEKTKINMKDKIRIISIENIHEKIGSGKIKVLGLLNNQFFVIGRNMLRYDQKIEITEYKYSGALL